MGRDAVMLERRLHVPRLDGTMLEAESPEAAAQICLRYLRHARDVRAEPEDQRFVYRTPGRDRFDRRVVVLLGARLPARGVRDERTLPLFMKELELLCGDRFTLFYANSGVQPMDSWSLEVLHEMLAVISARYRDSLDQLYVLHPGLWFTAASPPCAHVPLSAKAQTQIHSRICVCSPYSSPPPGDRAEPPSAVSHGFMWLQSFRFRCSLCGARCFTCCACCRPVPCLNAGATRLSFNR